MFLIYRPAEGDEQRWTFKPNRMPNHEAEAIEKRTGWTFAEFGIQLQKGSTLARRALLWVLLRRQHPVLRFEDVSFDVGELELEMDAAELELMRAELEKYPFDDEATRVMALAQIDAQLAAAEPDPDGPKAASPSGETPIG